MKASTMAQYGTLYLDGYYAGSTAGGGTFTWLTAEQASGLTPDGGVVIAPSDHTADCEEGCLVRQFSGPLNVKWFGAEGNSNGVTGHDDSSNIQATFTAAAARQTGVNFPASSGCYLVTQALTFTSYAPINMEASGSGICATGTGYTVLTITTGRDFQAEWNMYVSGPGGFINTGNTNPLDGIVWTNPEGVVGGQIRVNGFYGRCLYISDGYDDHFDSISVEDCGNPNANEYAFNLAAVSNTTNQTSISRLQVEKAYCQAINVDPTDINLLIENIHSEQAQDCAGLTTYWLGGSRSTYVNARIEAPAAAPSIVFYGSNTSYVNLFLGSTVAAKIRPNGSGDTCWLQFVGPLIGGTMIGYTNNTCTAMFDQGSVTNLATNVLQIVANGTNFGTLAIDNHAYISEYENAVRCYGCKIGTLSQDGSTSSSGIKLVNSIVEAVTSLPNRTWVESTEIDGNVTIASNVGLQMDANSVVTGNIAYAGGVLKIRNSQVLGNLSYTSGTNIWSFVNAHVSGTVDSNFGNIPVSSSQFGIGETSDNPIYTSGQPSGWRFFGTTTGWKPLANYP